MEIKDETVEQIRNSAKNLAKQEFKGKVAIHCDQVLAMIDRLRTAEANLAAMESQEIYGYDSSGDLCYELDKCMTSPDPIPLYSKPAPAEKPARITEQDVREILESYWNSSDNCGDWLNSGEGRTLLNKLNADRQVPSVAVPDLQALIEKVRKWGVEHTGCEPSVSCFHRALDELVAAIEGRPAVAVPDEINKKVYFIQTDETRELTIGVDNNDCPFFSIGHQRFSLDPAVVENRDQAKWYQQQLSIAFERLLSASAAPSHSQQSQGEKSCQ